MKLTTVERSVCALLLPLMLAISCTPVSAPANVQPTTTSLPSLTPTTTLLPTATAAPTGSPTATATALPTTTLTPSTTPAPTNTATSPPATNTPPPAINTPRPRPTSTSQPDNTPYGVFTDEARFKAITDQYPTIFNSQNGYQLTAPMNLISRGEARKYKGVYDVFNGIAIVNAFNPSNRSIDQWRGSFRTGNILQILGQGMIGNEPYEELLTQLQNGQQAIYDIALSNESGGILVPAYKTYTGVEMSPSVSVFQTHITNINPNMFEVGDFIAPLESPNSPFTTLPDGRLYKRLGKNTPIMLASVSNLNGFLKP